VIRGRRDCISRPGQKVVMHISNFRQPKNPLGACRAFALAAKKVDAKMVLIGDGPEITEVKQLCKELKICDRIQYLGKMDNVETILPAADVVLQPSYLESFGMVLLEAMSCGVPPVASDVDGIPEVVVHGETGLLADPDDHEALAAHLVTLLSDDALRARMAAAGRHRAIHTFHRDTIVPQYEAAYESALTLAPVV
jgi:N-acetyl-alpha-D-glucosaminyl L-malate synthase BshA